MKQNTRNTTTPSIALRYAVILDFEATCQARGTPRPQEIIELPSVLIDTQATEPGIIDSFERFVRPVHHPTLSAFCTALTSITQAQVEGAEPFEVVIAEHQAWLAGHGLDETNSLFVTCGDWDLKTMLPAQCQASAMALQSLGPMYQRWNNIKRTFVAVTQLRRGGMISMMTRLALQPEGHHHRGIDDCRNLARLWLALAQQGAELRPTTDQTTPARA